MEKEFKIVNKLGLHARASSVFVKEAGRFVSDIFIAKEDNEVNGKSIMGLLILAAACGTIVKLRVEGSDEEEAMSVLGGLIERGFDEE